MRKAYRSGRDWREVTPAVTAGSSSEISPRNTASASPSISVGPPLTMTTRAPARLAVGTHDATGYTLSVEPTASSRSQALALVEAPGR